MIRKMTVTIIMRASNPSVPPAAAGTKYGFKVSGSESKGGGFSSLSQDLC